MAAGADMASVSMHKSGGSLTQSSFLLTGKNINKDAVRQIINLTQTTSGSYLLLASLDLSRKRLALDGERIFDKVNEMAQYARNEINDIGGYYAYSRELINNDTIFDYDKTKLSINTLNIGLAGIEVYDILRDEYDIQIEFGDIGNILAYISVGDSYRTSSAGGSSFRDCAPLRQDKAGMMRHEYISPRVAVTPQKAFYADKQPLPIAESSGRIRSS